MPGINWNVVQRLLEAQAMTHQELADSLGKSLRQIFRIKSEGSTTPATLKKIAKVLGTDVSEIIGAGAVIRKRNSPSNTLFDKSIDDNLNITASLEKVEAPHGKYFTLSLKHFYQAHEKTQLAGEMIRFVTDNISEKLKTGKNHGTQLRTAEVREISYNFPDRKTNSADESAIVSELTINTKEDTAKAALIIHDMLSNAIDAWRQEMTRKYQSPESKDFPNAGDRPR